MARKDYRDKTIDDLVQIEPIALEEEFTRYCSDLVEQLRRHREIKREHAIASIDFDTFEAPLYEQVKAELIVENKGKTTGVTETSIKNRIKQNDEWIKRKKELVRLEMQKAAEWDHCEVMRAKKDMLIGLGADWRAELRGTPSVRRNDATEPSEDAREF